LGDALPRKVDLFDDSANKAIGQELRKLHSNYSSRQDLTNAMRDVDETVRALGGDFNVKVTDLVDFNYTIDDRFGATARGSFLALSEQAAKQGIRSPKDFAREQIIEKAIAFITPSDEQALNTMQRILSRNN
jgi:hypothetical protein